MIRPYKISDKGELATIFQLNIPTYFDPKEVGDYEEYLLKNGQTYFTIEHDSKIAGGVEYTRNENSKIGPITGFFFIQTTLD